MQNLENTWFSLAYLTKQINLFNEYSIQTNKIYEWIPIRKEIKLHLRLIN